MAALELDYDELWGDGSAGRVAVGGVDVVVAGALGDAGFTEFGNEVWPGGKVLGEWLAARPELVRGRAVLELGAGAGLPGLVAAAAGAASTTLTDLPEALPLLRANAAANAASCPRVVVAPLAWGARRRLDAFAPDVVVAADVVYKSQLVAPLLSTLRLLARDPAQRVVLANDRRSCGQARFAGALEACDMVLEASDTVGSVLLHVFRPAAPGDGDFGGDGERCAFATPGGVAFDVVQSPRGADGLGGLVWPGAVAVAKWLGERAPFPLADCRVLDLGAGTGFLGLALAAYGARRVVLSDEFVGLAAWNGARFLERHPAADVSVRRVRWGHEDDADADDVAAGRCAPEPMDLIVGAELAPMVAGHAALAAELDRRLAMAGPRRTARAVLALAPGASQSRKFLDAAAARPSLELEVLHLDVPAIRAGDPAVAGLDLTFDDGAETLWVAVFKSR
ncbi:lysine N-methyltransferase [Aureococcus anophagefferens]|uniref:Lysine N-methyltransferase n=1 Tax=Aureococcus anophagefferens TaxID=44056 RepID=A0ABR1GEE5_AURAN